MCEHDDRTVKVAWVGRGQAEWRCDLAWGARVLMTTTTRTSIFTCLTTRLRGAVLARSDNCDGCKGMWGVSIRFVSLVLQLEPLIITFTQWNLCYVWKYAWIKCRQKMDWRSDPLDLILFMGYLKCMFVDSLIEHIIRSSKSVFTLLSVE